MKYNLDNPVIVHKTMTLEQSERIEAKKENKIFKLLLIKYKKEYAGQILRFNNNLAYPFRCIGQ